MGKLLFLHRNNSEVCVLRQTDIDECVRTTKTFVVHDKDNNNDNNNGNNNNNDNNVGGDAANQIVALPLNPCQDEGVVAHSIDTVFRGPDGQLQFLPPTYRMSGSQNMS